MGGDRELRPVDEIGEWPPGRFRAAFVGSPIKSAFPVCRQSDPAVAVSHSALKKERRTSPVTNRQNEKTTRARAARRDAGLGRSRSGDGVGSHRTLHSYCQRSPQHGISRFRAGVERPQGT